MSRKSKSDIILESIVDLDKRLRKIEDDVAATKKAIRLLITVGNVIGLVVGAIIGWFQFFGRGSKGARGRKRGGKKK